jgi:hypothetical protein
MISKPAVLVRQTTDRRFEQGGPNYCRTTERVTHPVPTFLTSKGVPLV